MNQQEIMEKIRELAASIAQSQHPRNTLEIASLKNKCVELYDHVQILVPDFSNPETMKIIEEVKPLIEQQINKGETVLRQAQEPEREEKKPETLFAPVVESKPIEKPVEPVKEEVHVEEPIVQIKEEEKHIENPVLQEIGVKVENIPSTESQTNPSTSSGTNPSTGSGSKEELSIHEQYTKSAPKHTIKEGQTRIESLKSAISLNKKISFVNHLFNENTVEYAKAIEKLNVSANLEEANSQFDELKNVWNWDGGNELVKELHALIEKRFA